MSVKKISYIVSSIIFFFLLMIAMTKDAYAQLLTKSEYYTLADIDGEYQSGKLIPKYKVYNVLQYQGTKISEDISEKPGLVDARPGKVITLKNMRLFNTSTGKVTANGTVRLEFLTSMRITITDTYVAFYSSNTETDRRVKISLLDEKNEAVTTPMVFPLLISGTDAIASIDGNTLQNVVATEMPQANATISDTPIVDSLLNLNLAGSGMVVHLIYSGGASSYIFGYYTQSKVVDTTIFLFFNKTKVDIIESNKYRKPVIIPDNSVQDLTFSAKINQPLLTQLNEEDYKDLMVTVNMNNYTQPLDEELFWKKITIQDKYGNDYTNHPGVIKQRDPSNPSIFNVTYKKELFKQLAIKEDNQMTITMKLPMDNNKSELMTLFNKKEGSFHIPFEAKNNVSKAISTENMTIKMPPPTGEAILRNVLIGHTTTEINAADLVKDPKSILAFDVIKIKFERTKNFDKIGQMKVKVVLESTETAIKNTIEIPINVVPNEPVSFIALPQKISLQLKGEEVRASEEILFIDNLIDKNRNIEVRTSPNMVLQSKSEQVIAKIFKQDNTSLKENEPLTIMSAENKKYQFYIKAKAISFTKNEIYSGTLTFQLIDN